MVSHWHFFDFFQCFLLFLGTWMIILLYFLNIIWRDLLLIVILSQLWLSFGILLCLSSLSDWLELWVHRLLMIHMLSCLLKSKYVDFKLQIILLLYEFLIAFYVNHLFERNGIGQNLSLNWSCLYIFLLRTVLLVLIYCY
jgi:hypothetical protein